jgi:biotin operon repressor
MSISYFRIPVELLGLGITSAPELLILSLAAGFGRKGLKMSNASLARLLRVDRTTIIRAINRLKAKGYLTDASNKPRVRRLVLDSGKVPLPGSGVDATKVVAKCHQSSGVDATTELKEREETEGGYASPSPAGAPMRDDPDEAEAERLLRAVGVIV